jgi:antitoxin component YwqK of YwqJK toxin-antitoxin module
MRRYPVIILLFTIGCRYVSTNTEVSSLVKELSSDNPQIRDQSARRIRELLVDNPNSRSNDHGKEYWEQRIRRVKKGMILSEVVELLPPLRLRGTAPDFFGRGGWSGQTGFRAWRLDHYWEVTVHFSYKDNIGIQPDEHRRVLFTPELHQEAMRVYVEPSSDFTGTWVTWFVNGQKSHKIEYDNGKYHGNFVAFHDNGSKNVQQHYRDGVCHGKDIGWSRDGRKIYEGLYVNGKKEGIWTHWFPDGSLRSHCEYRDGKWHGTWTTWHEDGKKAGEVSYRNGKKHGTDRKWDKSGKLLWSRHFENGELMRSDHIDETAEPSTPADADKRRR